MGHTEERHAARIRAAREAFTDIYMRDLWGLSRMAPVPERLASYAEILGGFIRSTDAKSVVEIGTGFWTYQALMDWDGINYAGYDVAPLIVSRNRKFHARAGVTFHVLTEETRPSAADLVICKDVFQHLPNEDVLDLLDLCEQTAPLLLAINDIEPDANTNGAIERGGYRAIRLEDPPFQRDCVTLHEWTSLDFGVTTKKRASILKLDGQST